MGQGIPLSWLQLKHEKMKLFAAVSGVTVSVTLMWMQLGLMKALFASAVVFHGSLNGQLVVIHSQYEHLIHSMPFSSRLLYRLRGSNDVVDVLAIAMQPMEWKNPWNGETRAMQCYGVDTDTPVVNLPGFPEQVHLLRQSDVFLFDRKGRPRFGEVAEAWELGQSIEPELNRRRMTLKGMIDLGASFGIDGSIFVSHANFLRLFPSRRPGEIDVGVVQLRPGVSILSAQRQFQAMLGSEVKVLTIDEFIDVELSYWRSATPIGIVFSAGTVVGFFIGFIVVYQILYTDVTNHLPQYATLMAMGFSHGFLTRLVLQQSFQLAMLGFIPGSLIAALLYAGLREVTLLPLYMEFGRAIGLCIVTVFMCMFSGMLAIRKLRTADPANVF